jgi:hypothetical protein
VVQELNAAHRRFALPQYSSRHDESARPPNSTLKLSRPVFGRAAEPPVAEQYLRGVRLVADRFRRDAFVAATTLPLFASPRGHPAAQLSVRPLAAPERHFSCPATAQEPLRHSGDRLRTTSRIRRVLSAGIPGITRRLSAYLHRRSRASAGNTVAHRSPLSYSDQQLTRGIIVPTPTCFRHSGDGQKRFAAGAARRTEHAVKC